MHYPLYIIALILALIWALLCVVFAVRFLIKRIHVTHSLRRICKKRGHTYKRLRNPIASLLWRSAKPDLAITTGKKTYLIRFWGNVVPMNSYFFVNEHYAIRSFILSLRVAGVNGSTANSADSDTGAPGEGWTNKLLYLSTMKRPKAYADADVQEVLLFHPAPTSIKLRNPNGTGYESMAYGDYLGDTCLCYGSYLRQMLLYDEYEEESEESRRRQTIDSVRFKSKLRTEAEPDSARPKLADLPPFPAKYEALDFLRRRVYKRLIKYAGWLLVGLVVVFGGGVDIYDRYDFSAWVPVTIFVGYAIIAFFASGVPKLFGDRSFEGKILSAEYGKVASGKLSDSFIRDQFYMKAKLKIEERDGTIWFYEKVAVSTTQDLRQNYVQDGLVRHIRWADYDQCFRGENDPHVRCVCCGAENRRIDQGCSVCGASLIRELPTKKKHSK